MVAGEGLRRSCAAVTCMDSAIGEIVAQIRKQGQENDTLIVFQSDNGGSGNGGNAPLKGSKSTLWEGGLRVPFIARWPGKIPAGRVSDEFVTTLELLPTIAATGTSKLPDGVVLDGHNMLPFLTGEAPSPRKEMFWEFRGQKAARVGIYKWIESAKANGLFDLSADIGEKNDIAPAMPDLVADIRSRWATWRKQMDAAEPRGPFRDY